ncbi:MAG: ATP-binding protein [Saprospiraceae bacterium]
MEFPLVGRKEEQETLKKALQSTEAEMVAVIGRRRVGKTFLVSSVYQEQIVFEITGIQNGSLENQLANFSDQLTEFAKPMLPLKQPSNWLEAFQMLRTYLKQLPDTEKKVIFFDELPWIATHKSGFLNALGYFWNSWASRQAIVLVICGSAASWMIQKVVNNRGGLHNRITKRIYLEPFTLGETEHFLKSRNIHFNRYQIIQLYMAMGGIPHYLKEVEGGKSATQNIDAICFSKNGLLKDEFLRLYPSLFANAENHFAVIRALGEKPQGLNRNQLVEMTKLPNGGGFSKVLEELTHSGFIAAFRTFGKQKKEKLYRLTDEYSLFYLKFIEQTAHEGEHIWQHLSQTQSYKTWAGYAFESICLQHIPQIKKALEIAGIYSLSSAYYKRGNANEPGIQIDLLIDRNDQVINICEIKYFNQKFSISKAYAEKLRDKMEIFSEATKTRKQIFLVIITTFGLNVNEHSLGLVNQILTMDDLFA